MPSYEPSPRWVPKDGTHARRVLALLRDEGPTRSRDLLRATGCAPSCFRRLSAAGHIEKGENQNEPWVLTRQGRDRLDGSTAVLRRPPDSA